MILDFRYLMIDPGAPGQGCWILDTGYSILDSRYWILDGCDGSLVNLVNMVNLVN